jgi:hypothetical protein
MNLYWTRSRMHAWQPNKTLCHFPLRSIGRKREKKEQFVERKECAELCKKYPETKIIIHSFLLSHSQGSETARELF